jgi:hypothetical protein
MPNIYDIAGNLRQPDIIGNIRQGQQYAMQLQQQQQASQDQQNIRDLAPQVIAGNPQAFDQAAAINPQAAEQYQQAGDMQIKRLQGAMAYIDQQKTPQAKEAAYQQVRPYLARFGQDPPATFAEAEPKMEAARAQIAMLNQPQAQKFVNVAAGGAVVDPTTGQVVYHNDVAAKLPGGIQELQYLQEHPDLAAFQRRQQAALHPTVEGGGRAPMGYRFRPDGSLEAIPGGPADTSAHTAGNLNEDALTNAAWRQILLGDSGIRGYNKEAVAQRALIANNVAKIAKDAGVSPQELTTTSGRNKALQSSLTNLQKQSDVMQKSEQGFQNNLDQALQLSEKLTRSGSPVINKWLLGGRAAIGDPDVAAFDAAINAASVDYARIMSGQTGAGGTPISTAEEAKQLLRKELSNQSLQAVADVLHRDIMGQQQAVDQQRQTIMSAMQAFGKPSPEYKQDGEQPSKSNDYSKLWGG